MANPPNPKAPEGINIDAWAEKTVSAIPLSTTTISAVLVERPASAMRGATDSLEIPLDQEPQPSLTQQRREERLARTRATDHDDEGSSDETTQQNGYARRRGSEPRRRDSMKRREALLKGKEGTRRRQKWENDRLLGNPAFQPPEPHDWAPHPTHPVHNVPYSVAPLWESRYAATARERADKARRAARATNPASQVPRELRDKLKRARGARSLLQDLEEQVRDFVRNWQYQQKMRTEGWYGVDAEQSATEDESGDDEVVFVGRRDHSKGHSRSDSDGIRMDKLVFDSLVDDHGASFGRWLVHSIASYYNLRTWSVTTGNPARREAYVGIPDARLHSEPIGGNATTDELPRPLWVMV